MARDGRIRRQRRVHVSETLTDEHHDWVTSTLGADPREYSAPEATAAPAPPAPEPPAAAEDDEKSGGFFSSVADMASSAAGAVSHAAGAVADTAVSAANTVADTAVSAAHTVADTAVSAAHKVADTAVAVEHAVVDTAKSVATKVADTATSAAHAVSDGAAAAKKAVVDTTNRAVETVKQAIIGPPPPPDIPKARADAKFGKLSPEDQTKVQAVLDGAKTDKERQYITKGLAAGHTPAELEKFAKLIEGKDEKWQQDNLHLVGDSNGKGIEQQWSFSCGPTTVEAIKGELDPLYSLKVRADNPDFNDADNADPLKKNPKLARDQQEMLVMGGGTATSRDDPDQLGSGLNFKKLLNKQTGSTGLEYDSKVLGRDTTVDEALNTMQDGLQHGIPVPITVGDAKSPFAHAAVVTAVAPGPPRTFTIHDPYYGKTDTFTEDQIKNDQVNVGGWKHVGVVFPAKFKE
jgi:hypothetical protein